MVTRITKFRSRNLFGETRKEEKTRVIKQLSKAIVQGKTPQQVREINADIGTTQQQREARMKILRASNLQKQKIPKARERLRFL